MWNILWSHPLGGKVLSTEFRSWGAADTASKTDTVSLKNGWKPTVLAQAEPGLPAILIVQDRRPADAKRTRTAAAKRLSGPEVSGLAPVAEELVDAGAGELATAGEARGIVICTNCGSKLSESILPAATSVNPNHPTT